MTQHLIEIGMHGEIGVRAPATVSLLISQKAWWHGLAHIFREPTYSTDQQFFHSSEVTFLNTK